MVSVSMAVLAAGLLCWPARSAERRLRVLAGPPEHGMHRSGARLAPEVAGTAGALLAGWWLLGAMGALTGAIVVATVRRLLRSHRLARTERSAAAGLSEALGGLVAELRAGAHPALAVDGVIAEASPAVAPVLRAIGAASRLGGDVGTALAGVAEKSPSLRGPVAQLGRAWTLAHRHGVPLAEVLEAVRRDLDTGIRFADQLRARMAGPRASAAVLAALPLLGVLLGEAMGAHPIRVLASPGGGFLLLTGCVLLCVGAVWCSRITRVGATS